MKLSDLEEYEERERIYVRTIGDKAVRNGTVVDAARIYQDKKVAGRVGFRRAGAPLKALLLLYPTTVVYVPPTSQDRIERQFGMGWSTFLELAEAGSVTPIIGHPTHYQRKAFFNDLFYLNPASVWARGDELAHHFAGAAEYWNIAMAEVPAEEMATLGWVRAKFRNHFPNVSSQALIERAATEIRTNFVDLCIFGFEPLARNYAALSDLSWGARRILEVSELLTYPSLLGMGGVPSYGINNDRAIAAASDLLLWLQAPERRTLRSEAMLLVEGLSLRVPEDLASSDVAAFHAEGMARRLWAALDELEGQVSRAAEDADELVQASVVAEGIIREALQEVSGLSHSLDRKQTIRRAGTTSDMSLKIGTAAALTVASHGILGLDWIAATIAGAGTSPAVWALRAFGEAAEACEVRLSDWIATRKYGGFAVQLWWLNNWRVARPAVPHGS